MDPFGNVLGVRAREAQPHMAGIIPTRVEGNAHNIRDLGTDRLGEHRRGVDTFRRLHPYEQTALRVSPTAPGREILFKSCLLYTSDAADDLLCVDLGGRRIIKKKNETHRNS